MTKEREKVLGEVSEQILGTCTSSSTDSLVSKQTIQAVLGTVKGLDKKMGLLETKIDLLLDCKDCLRRAYKNVDRKDKPSSKPSSSSSTSTSSTIICTLTPTPSTPSTFNCSATAASTPSTPSTFNCSATAASTPSTSTPKPLMKSVDEKDDMDTDESQLAVVDTPDVPNSYVGDAKYGITIKKDDLDRCKATAKTAEKLLLNLLEFVLSGDDINNCTVYGNKQHNKAAIKENKRYALKSQVFSTFFLDFNKEDRQKEWERMVKVVNDKIRGMRKGKYKSITN